MKSLMWLLEGILADAGIRCRTDTHADYRKIVGRVEHEGESFLTITLPIFGKAFERALEEGRWSPGSVTGFRHRAGLPVFLRGFLTQVFDTCGILHETPSLDAIHCIRQICLMWKKILLPCSSEREWGAFDDYISIDSEVGRSDASVPDWAYRLFGDVSDVLWSDSLHDADNSVIFREYLPRHGPGATAERVNGNAKWLSKQWTKRLNAWFFPFKEFALGRAYWDRSIEENASNFRDPGSELPVRVIAVPKTLTAPRIIAIEPVCMQYAQQAVKDLLYSSLEVSPLTKGRINFTFQEPNRNAALLSSRSGKLATLDMKEASDRVSLRIVHRMLRSVPSLLGAVMACRSQRAAVPTRTNPKGEVIELCKFASMGSALCFPIEAMVFYTIIIAARIHAAGGLISLGNIKKYSRDVLVYGDDIVIPSDEVQPVISLLETFGLKVNANKSFWTGKFRESCGLDAYDGVEVTPFYIRREFPNDRRSTSEIGSWISFANQAYKAGYWQTAKRVREKLEALLGPIPHVQETSPVLGWHSFRNYASVHRWNPTLHRFEVKGMVIQPKMRPDPLSGEDALRKCLLTTVGSPSVDERHLMSTVRRGGEVIKHRWAPAG